MLGKSWRVVAVNNTGAALTDLDVFVHPWRLDGSANGDLVYGSEIKLLENQTPADATPVASAAQDNAAGKNLGIKGKMTAAGSGTSGNVELYMEWSDEAGAFPSDAANAVPAEDLLLIAALSFGGAQTRSVNFSYG